MGFRISVDTGGTFTDIVVMDDAGQQTIGKALTTKNRIFVGMREAVEVAARDLGMTMPDLLDETDLLIYGTTRATNAIVTRTVAKTAFVTTMGFPDTLVLKEGGKTNPHDFTKDYPEPYIPRRYTFEIEERMSAEGTASVPFNEAQARSVVQTLKERGFEAVAVCFLWSIANPEHELRLGALLTEIMPGVPFTLSHQLVPIVREYRRASATAIDASLKPLMQDHLRGLETDLRAAGYKNDILVSTSVGGVMLIDELIDAPIHTAKSGPAMAPIAGLTYSTIEKMGDNVIVCDTGGTTFDVGLVRDGRLAYSRDTWLGGQWTGHLLGISSVDVRSIGAGGGSIAWIDEGGLMRVGPQSAGAEPGPACYGRGGTMPTVSDAACVLGYFDPDFFLGGRMQLDIPAARQAIATVANRIGRSVEETAWNILNLATELMIKAIQEITIAEGVNPRESTIVAGGGAAGINILPIAQELGCERVILPKVASALSASGMQFADIVKEETASLVTTSDRFSLAGVNRTLDGARGQAEEVRHDAGRARRGHPPYRVPDRGPLPGPGLGTGNTAAVCALPRSGRCRCPGRELSQGPRARLRHARRRQPGRMRQLESPAGRQAGLGSETRRHRHGDDRTDAFDNPPLLFRRQRAGRHAHLQIERPAAWFQDHRPRHCRGADDDPGRVPTDIDDRLGRRQLHLRHRLTLLHSEYRT